MKSFFQILVFLTVPFWFAGCNAVDKFAIVESSGPVFNGLRSVHGRAVVENSSRRDFVIEHAVLQFRYKKRELATARLMLPVEVPGNAVSGVRYDLKLESESLSNLQTLQNRMETNPSQVFVNVNARVRYGNIRKKVTIEDIPYTQIIANFGEL